MKRFRRLTKQNLRVWIASHRSGQDVGAISMPCGCPIARFIRSTFPDPDQTWIGVQPEKVDIQVWSGPNLKCEVYGLPKWANMFILGVDTGEGFNKATYINREEALQLLNTL